MRRAQLAPLSLLLVLAACAESDGPTAVVRTPASLHFTVLCTTDCIFGPETFTRGNGGPNSFTRNFTATAGSNYTIDIDDLGSQGADGSVTLNGVALMQPRAITGEVGPRHYTLDISLLENNRLDVKMLGRKGSQLKISIAQKPAAECYPDLPAPDVTVDYGVAVENGADYFLSVSNYADFPDALFEPAPDLPACGLNTNSSRTWVDIYSSTDAYLYGFCAFGQASDLNGAWFHLPTGSTVTAAYMVLDDRRCGVQYKSNTFTLPTTLQ
jgi:hypothetical protein